MCVCVCATLEREARKAFSHLPLFFKRRSWLCCILIIYIDEKKDDGQLRENIISSCFLPSPQTFNDKISLLWSVWSNLGLAQKEKALWFVETITHLSNLRSGIGRITMIRIIELIWTMSSFQALLSFSNLMSRYTCMRSRVLLPPPVIILAWRGANLCSPFYLWSTQIRELQASHWCSDHNRKKQCLWLPFLQLGHLSEDRLSTFFFFSA